MTSEGEERINHHIQNEVVNRINDQAVGVMDVSGQPFKPITSMLGLTSFPCFFLLSRGDNEVGEIHLQLQH